MSELGSRYRPHRKDSNEVLDYVINWNGGSDPFLGVDTIATSVFTVPAGLTSPLATSTTTTTTIWLAGGTAYAKYAVHNRITTAGGRTGDKTIYIAIKEK